MENHLFSKETIKIPIHYLIDTELETDEKFKFLRSELKNWYDSYFSDQKPFYESSNKAKSVNLNLHLLLSELVMTASSKKADLLNSIYDWYQSKTQRSENTCSPKAKIETNIITYSPISQTESFLIRQSLSPSLPKTKKITRSDLLNLMKHILSA